MKWTTDCNETVAIFSTSQLEHLENLFIENECDTDEYRESQPIKGLNYIAEMTGIESIRKTIDKYIAEKNHLDEESKNQLIDDLKNLPYIKCNWERGILDQTIVWLENYTGGYSSSNNLKPLMRNLFDHYVLSNMHPYGFTEEELKEIIEE